MKVFKHELAGAIKSLKAVVPKNPVLPSLKGILFNNGTLTASNTEITMQISLDSIEGEKFILPESSFTLIENLPEGEIEFTISENGTYVDIATGKIRNRFQAMDPDTFDKDRYFYRNRDMWVSFAHHGRFSRENFDDFERNIDEQLSNASDFLKHTDYLFITFGTAFCYKFIPRDLIVSNCHKIPNFKFDRIRLVLETEMRPDLKIIFTVSPVRHAGDGMHENTLSKSVLLLAVDKLVDNETTFYFPAYEFLIDDLRDYRFYAKDLSHPNDMAVEYLEEKVAESFFTTETQERVWQVRQENKFLNHKRLHRD